jgi:hypothetical protein
MKVDFGKGRDKNAQGLRIDILPAPNKITY